MTGDSATPFAYPASKVVDSLDELDYRDIRFPIFVLYDHPKDFPDNIVARLWDMGLPTPTVCLFNSLGEARAAMPQGFLRFGRNVHDDAVIIEFYV